MNSVMFSMVQGHTTVIGGKCCWTLSTCHVHMSSPLRIVTECILQMTFETCKLMSCITCSIPESTCIPSAKVVECKLVYDQIGEIISLDGENDNKVTSFAEFSNEFEDMEFSWKGCVTSNHFKEEFAEVDEAAETLYIVVSPFLLNFYCAHLVVSVQSLPHDPHEMKVITAYLLAILGGNASPSAKDLKGILGSVGVDHDNDMIEHLLTQVKGKYIMELIADGREKLASVLSGGGAVAVASAAAGVGGGAAASAAAEPKK
ncbi:hypothetical protein ACS0TY_027727 [Phlomoides rotata]